MGGRVLGAYGGGEISESQGAGTISEYHDQRTSRILASQRGLVVSMKFMDL